MLSTDEEHISLHDLQEEERELDMKLEELERQRRWLDRKMTVSDNYVAQILIKTECEEEYRPIQPSDEIERFSFPAESAVDLMGSCETVDVRDYKPDVSPVSDLSLEPEVYENDEISIGEEIAVADQAFSSKNTAVCPDLYGPYQFSNGKWIPTRRKSSFTRKREASVDEKLAASQHLPATAHELATMPMSELDQLLKGEGLSEQQKNLMKEIRGRGIHRLLVHSESSRRAQMVNHKKKGEKVRNHISAEGDSEHSQHRREAESGGNTQQKRKRRKFIHRSDDEVSVATHHLPLTVDELTAISLRGLKTLFKRVVLTDQQQVLMKQIRLRGLKRMSGYRVRRRRAQDILLSHRIKGLPEVNEKNSAIAKRNPDQLSATEASPDDELAGSQKLPATVCQPATVSMGELNCLSEGAVLSRKRTLIMREIRFRPFRPELAKCGDRN